MFYQFASIFKSLLSAPLFKTIVLIALIFSHQFSLSYKKENEIFS